MFISSSTATAYSDIITLAEARIHLRIDDTNTAEDTYIGALRDAALQYIEKMCSTQLRDTTGIEYWKNEILCFTIAPVISITNLQYRAADGTWTTFTDYDSDLISIVPEIMLTDMPDVSDEHINIFRSNCRVGYAAVSGIPAPIIAAAKLALGDLYENRSSGIVGTISSGVELTIERLLANYRL